MSRSSPRSFALALAAAVVAAACDTDDEPREREPACSGYALLQRSAAAGLSKVEQFPDTPAQAELFLNRNLVDGAVGISTGIDLGYGRTQSSDSAFRHIGLRLAEATAAVDLLYVWVDRSLPAEVSGAYSWSAYRSDDNVAWVAIPIAGSVRFGFADNRFEIPIASAAASYLKVVTRPLATGVTTDASFSTVFVTELQAFDSLCVTPP
jgi:hypothetical protein